MAFTLEKEMYAAMATRFQGLFDTNHTRGIRRTLSGRPVGFVIPDFLYVRSLKSAWGTKPHKMTALDASIVAELLKVHQLKAKTIAERLFAAPRRIEERLRLLTNTGILSVKAEVFYTIRRHSFVDGVKVIAVEVKLRRWREALRQAISYHRFANQSYIAMPDHVIVNNSELRSSCEAAGVGILSVGTSETTIVRRARAQAVQSPEWVWLVAKTLFASRSGMAYEITQ